MTSFLSPARRVWLRLGLNEIGPLVSFLGLALFALAFVMLANEVMEGETNTFDRALLLALRSPDNPADPLGPGWLEEAARDITGLGGTAVLGIVTVSAFIALLMAGKRGAALLVLIAVDGGMILSGLLKSGFDRPRPDLVPHAMEVYTASFPSGHAMLSAIAYLTLGALFARMFARKRLKAFIMGLAVFLTLIIGVSRVYLGVHWPSDVLAGWCVGAAWASLCWFVTLQLQRRGQVEKPGEAAAES
ncbi:phosphatase PAP2 family protein [Microvirga flavescens]|uniref:phosphatase PAP2 family protein n=1 Tax=Microvirga flavescens TaxID=2249811 RepID=UPI000DDB8D07|nr:phosphatase PAP2 family protein [Microvirga flavescens]